MGQAKQRGTFEQRKAMALAKQAKEREVEEEAKKLQERQLLDKQAAINNRPDIYNANRAETRAHARRNGSLVNIAAIAAIALSGGYNNER